MIALLYSFRTGRIGHITFAGSAFPALLGLIAPVLALLYAGGVRFALQLILASILTLAWQYLFARTRGHKLGLDGIVTGILIALLTPAGAPLWQLVLAVSFGVVLGEQIFGGRGRNFVHPAVAALAFLMFSFTGFDYRAGPEIPLLSLIPAALLLMGSGQASWRLLVATFGTMALAIWLQGNDPSSVLLSGAIGLAILFLAADPVCSAATGPGRWAQGILTGLLIGLFSQAGAAFGATVFAILMSSIFAPLIDYVVVALHIKRRARRHG